MPPVVTTSSAEKPSGDSLNVKVIVAVSLAPSVAMLLVIARLGARVSMLMLGVVPAWPSFPIASV